MAEQENEFPQEEAIEAYCVSCKEKREVINPVAVYTSRGQAATRGTCPVCGTNVFRMGRTHLHGNSKAPDPIQVVPKGVKKAKAAYVAASVTDAEFAGNLAEELKKIGVYVWVDNSETADDTSWSNGVHPALEQCTHLVVVLSGFTEKTSNVQDAWTYFRNQRKPVVVAQIEDVDPPDDLRSRPRFDFSGDYKSAFRGLVEALSK